MGIFYRDETGRPPVVIVLAMLLFLLATGGYYGGIMLLSDISGASLGVPPSLLDHLPISTFLIPGIILTVFMGILPTLAVIGILRKDLFPYFNRFSWLKKYSWAYCTTIFIGIFLMGWTGGEMLLWGVNTLSMLYLIWGGLIILICLVPRLKNHYVCKDCSSVKE